VPKQNTVNSVPKLLRDAVTCPFCSLLCDDLETVTRGTQVSVDAKACPKAHKAFAAATPAGSPLVDGQPVTLEQALSAAKRILKYARQPLFSGLATDVDGVVSFTGLRAHSPRPSSHEASSG
jgi:formylmethanofuran dehydrogenase subunit B